MKVIGSDGRYEMEPGTQTPRESEHPVHQARIEIALGRGTWPCVPGAGHDLARYGREKQTEAKVDEFTEDLRFYLRNYSPEVRERLARRGAVSLDLVIDEEALDV